MRVLQKIGPKREKVTPLVTLSHVSTANQGTWAQPVDPHVVPLQGVS